MGDDPIVDILIWLQILVKHLYIPDIEKQQQQQ